MSEPLRILYIDDDAGLARLVQKDLERRGHTVEVVNDVYAGVKRISEGAFDVVALDHYMPAQDGLATLAAIRALPGAPPVIYVTATQEGTVAVAALKAGAADYVIKDVAGEFLTLLAAAIEQAVEAVRLRLAKEQAEQEIRASRDRFEALAAERDLLLRESTTGSAIACRSLPRCFTCKGRKPPFRRSRRRLTRVRQRVGAVAHVHRRLYTAGDLKTVALHEYLAALAEDLRYGAAPDTIALQTEPVEVEPDRAVAAGIVVTELVLNALKHAYPNGSGPIRIKLEGTGNRVVLSVDDDGVGQCNDGTGRGIGKTIVRAMAQKLEAALSYDGAHQATRVALEFATGLPRLRAASPVL